MADRAEELHVELAALLATHQPTLTEGELADLVRLEESYGWRPGTDGKVVGDVVDHDHTMTL